MRKIIKYTDKINGVDTMIAEWEMEMINETNKIWNTYIYVMKRNITDEQFKRYNLRAKSFQLSPECPVRTMFDYHKLEDDFNFSGGITFYEKMFNQRGDVVGFKIGNDYNHIWNGGETYESVLSDLTESVNIFLSQQNNLI